METKRTLFQSLVEPIFSYGLHAWALTVAKRAQLNGTYGRMLRFALGLPPAFITRDIVGTEKLYGDLPFISSLIEKRTFTLLGHTLREHIKLEDSPIPYYTTVRSEWGLPRKAQCSAHHAGQPYPPKLQDWVR
eukprot:PhF_6_TR4824/c4_g1_i10/m.6695